MPAVQALGQPLCLPGSAGVSLPPRSPPPLRGGRRGGGMPAVPGGWVTRKSEEADLTAPDVSHGLPGCHAATIDTPGRLHYTEIHDPSSSRSWSRSSGAGSIAVSVAHVRRRAVRRGACRCGRAVGRGVVGHDVNGPMAAHLRFHDLTLGYDRHPAVHHLTGAVEEGAMLAVVGPNGAGKSTLFKGVLGLLGPLSGT